MTILMGLFLIQDGISTGLIYSLMSISILLVFLVTRVLWIPVGELVVFSALTFIQIGQGRIPSMLWLTIGLGITAAIIELVSGWKQRPGTELARRVGVCLAIPLLSIILVHFLVSERPALFIQVGLTLLLMVPLGAFIYRIAIQPLMNASTLVLLFISVAIHLALMGLGLVFFGPDGHRAPAIVPGRFNIGEVRVSWQLIVTLAASLAMILMLWLFFERTMWGKALKATAINRIGAQLVGLWVESAGIWAFTIASAICAVSGVLIAPMMTLYYDSGFALALKGFIGVVLGGMVSFPVAAIGALGVGIFEAFAAFSASAYKDVIVFALLIPILMWRSWATPHALLAEVEEEE
jgi:branched-chain amino acid transport system permease protein